MRTFTFLCLLAAISLACVGAQRAASRCYNENERRPDARGRCDKYIQCVNGWEVLHTCIEAGTVYSDKAKECVDIKYVDPPCGISTTQRVPTTTTTFCTGLASGNYLQDETACTNEYYQCHQDGRVVVSQCEEPLSFSPLEGGCVRQEENELCDKNECRNRADGLYKHPEDKCDEYLSCIRGWPIIVRCLHNNEAWNDDEKRCMDRALFQPPCGTLAPNECEGRPDGFYAHSDPAVCDEYLSCIRGWPVISRCAESNQAWNAAENRCMDRNLFPPPCGTFVEQPTTPNPASCVLLPVNVCLLPPTPAFSCDNRAPGNYPATSLGVDCTSYFFQCHANEIPLIVNCPAGLVFDSKDLKCVPFLRCAASAEPLGAARSLINPVASCELLPVNVCLLPPTPVFSCDGRAAGNYAATTIGVECSSYFFQCHAGDIPLIVNCPAGRVYDQQEAKCIPYRTCVDKHL